MSVEVIAKRLERRSASVGFRAMLSLALASAVLALVVTGCSKSGSDEDLVLAKVGSVEISAAEYKDKLGKFTEDELPKNPDGQPLDTATMEGREAFLGILINKEVMQLKAVELGYDQEQDVVTAKEHLIDYYANEMLWEDEIEVPANFISEEALDAYVARLGEKRQCEFLITNFEADALEAREQALAGKPWDELVAEYHDGAASPTGKNEVTVPWGQFEESFENAVFAVEEGGVTEPISTPYGYWVLKVNKVKNGPPPDVSNIKTKVLDSIRARKINAAKNELKEEVRRSCNFTLHDDALWICYQGLPEGETVVDPETNKPFTRDKLKPLNIDPADLDAELYSYESLDGVKSMTIGEYKSLFDQMSVFQRPKRHELLGGFRQKLIGDLDKAIMTDEAIRRGYREDPRVIKATMKQINQMMVTRLHDDVIEVDDQVTSEQIQQFWDEHRDDYHQPERRVGNVVDCASLETAEKARAELLAGADFLTVLKKYGSDRRNLNNEGKFGPLSADFDHVLVAPLFGLGEPGDISEPVALGEAFAVVVLGEIIPPGYPELEERTEVIGQRIRGLRKDAELNRLLEQWKQQYGVEINETNLAKMPSWQELLAEREQQQEELVPVT
jgi:parvulin-like peptidyl-prolyl isomerase